MQLLSGRRPFSHQQDITQRPQRFHKGHDGFRFASSLLQLDASAVALGGLTFDVRPSNVPTLHRHLPLLRHRSRAPAERKPPTHFRCRVRPRHGPRTFLSPSRRDQYLARWRPAPRRSTAPASHLRQNIACARNRPAYSQRFAALPRSCRGESFPLRARSSARPGQRFKRPDRSLPREREPTATSKFPCGKPISKRSSPSSPRTRPASRASRSTACN